MFGLHDNASITRAQSDTAQLLKSVLLTESSGGGSGGADKETTINTVAADILSKVWSKTQRITTFDGFDEKVEDATCYRRSECVPYTGNP